MHDIPPLIFLELITGQVSLELYVGVPHRLEQYTLLELAKEVSPRQLGLVLPYYMNGYAENLSTYHLIFPTTTPDE